MRDTELYRHLLGIGLPLDRDKRGVERGRATRRCVGLPRRRGHVVVPRVRHDGPPTLRPRRGACVARHLDSCQFRTLLHARPPRVRCPTHVVRQVTLPWAEGRSRNGCDQSADAYSPVRRSPEGTNAM
jgi:transposase